MSSLIIVVRDGMVAGVHCTDNFPDDIEIIVADMDTDSDGLDRIAWFEQPEKHENMSDWEIIGEIAARYNITSKGSI